MPEPTQPIRQTTDAPPAAPSRLQQIAETFSAVHAPLSVDETVRRITDAARELIGARQAVTSFAVGQDWAQAVNAVSLSEEYAAWRDYAAPPDGRGIYRVVCESGRPLRLTQTELEAHPAWRGFSGHAPEHPPMRGCLAAPLTDRDGRNMGLVQLSDKDAGEFTEDDEHVLVQLAQLASLAVETATLYEAQRATSHELQRRLLPPEIPAVEGLDLAVRYVSAGADAEVGGDWYDVIDLGGEQVGLVVGDVMGRGVSAASAMGQLRVGLRAYALEGLQPGQVLQRLSRLVHSLGGEYLVTVVYAVWNLRLDALTFATAGHLPPLLRTPEGTVTFVEGEPGLPIGVVEEPEYVEHRLDAPPGATLLLYTDGLVERRDVPLDRTLDILAKVTASHRNAAAELADRALAAARDPEVEDDIAVLVASRPGPAVQRSGSARVDDALTVPPDPAAVRRARRWLVGAVADDIEPDVADTLALLASEVITNAVVHAGTPVTVTVQRGTDRLRVCVIDQQPHVPSIRAFTEDRQGGRGMGLVEALADAWGVDIAQHAKTVWFELTLTEPAGSG